MEVVKTRPMRPQSLTRAQMAEPQSADSGATTGDAGAQDGGSHFAFDIPVTPVTEDGGATFVTTQISVGGSAPFTVLLDTGSVGLRVLSGSIQTRIGPSRTRQRPRTRMEGRSSFKARSQMQSWAFGGVSTGVAIPVEDVTSATCTAAVPNCYANGVPFADFKFRNEYPAILGIGMRAAKNLASHIAALGAHEQYVLSLGPYGSGTGFIHLDPDSTEISRFNANLVHLTSNGSTSVTGVPGWMTRRYHFA